MLEGVQVLDSSWRYVYLNEAAARHGRRRREDLLGRRITDEYPGIEHTELFGLMRRCMEERRPQELLNRFSYPDGREGWFELRLEPVPQGVLILSIDVSERVVAEQELRASQERLAVTLECMDEAVLATDLEDRVVLMNRVAQELTGWSLEEARDEPLLALVGFLDPDSREPDPGPTQRVLREPGARFPRELVLVARDGREVRVAGSAGPIRDSGGALRGAVLALRDVTDERLLAQQLEQARKMETIGRLAGGIAHDFNNLLSVIGGYAEMLLQTLPPDSRERRRAAQVHAAGQQAAALTRQLLAFSRRQVLQPVRLDPNQVIGDLVPMLRRLIGEDVELSVRLQRAVASVVFDPGQLEQVLLNLAINARDAMPRGGRLSIETADVELDAGYAGTHAGVRSGPHVMIAVTDTGVGMSPEIRERIFEPFFTTKALGRGTGLGLSTVYGIVKQGGGHIWVYSEPDRGTTFKVYVPRAAGDAPSAPPREPRRSPSRGHETILLVEDDDAVRELILTVLEDGGYTVLDGGNGDAALELAGRHAGEVHLLLTDVVLPRRSGPELAAEIRRRRPEIRVAFMSGYTDDAVVGRGLLEPGTPFVEKPVSAQALLERVRSFLA